MREYEPPYTLQQIRDNYPEDVFQELAKCPIHRWRAETGIELVHREPTLDELNRIWANWQLMTPEEKAISDQKSIELFGVDNETRYLMLIDDYDPYTSAEHGKLNAKDVSKWNDLRKMII